MVSLLGERLRRESEETVRKVLEKHLKLHELMKCMKENIKS